TPSEHSGRCTTPWPSASPVSSTGVCLPNDQTAKRSWTTPEQPKPCTGRCCGAAPPSRPVPACGPHTCTRAPDDTGNDEEAVTMARWWRRDTPGDGRGQEHPAGTDGPPGTDPYTPEPGTESGGTRRPVGGHITITEVTEGQPEREIARVGFSAEEIHTMRARSAIDRLGPEHPDALTAMLELAR